MRNRPTLAQLCDDPAVSAEHRRDRWLMRPSALALVLIIAACAALAFHRAGGTAPAFDAARNQAVAASLIAFQSRGDAIPRDLDWVALTEQQFIEAGQREYSRIAEFVPVTDLARLREALQKIPIPPGSIHEAQRRALLDFAAEFLHFRYGQPSAKEYIDWRGRGGAARWRGRDELERVYWVDATCKSLLGAPPSPDASAESIFADLFTPMADHGGGVNRVETIAAEPLGLAASVAVLTPARPISIEHQLKGAFPSELWHGRRTGSLAGWILYPDSDSELLTREKRVTDVRLGMVARYADGSRFPIMLSCQWDARQRHWRLGGVHSLNYKSSKLVSVPY